MIELWKPVPFEPFGSKYVISNLGRVKPIKKSVFSRAREDCLKYGIGARGYAFVSLYCDGLVKQCSVHRMVAIAFIGSPPDGKNIVCHLDDNKTNNAVDNLVWGSAADNMKQMRDHRRSLFGSKNPRALLNDVKVREIRNLYSQGGVTYKCLALDYGVSPSTIERIVSRKNWSYLD